jgi:hypothetical protein
VQLRDRLGEERYDALRTLLREMRAMLVNNA